MKKTFKQSSVLTVISIARRLFYNTPVHRNKFVNIIYQKLFRSAYKPTQEHKIEYQGSTYFFPGDDITILPTLLNQSYEKTMFEVIQKTLKPGMNFVDIGANVGLYSVFASKVVGQNGTVVSFEPEPSNYRYLLRNLELNSCNNVRAHKLAIGEEQSTMNLHVAAGSIGTHTLVNTIGDTGSKNVPVKVVTIDSYLKTTRISMIKLDIEGYELSALKGAVKSLKSVDFLFFEYTEPSILNERNELLSILQPFKYFYLIDEKTGKVKDFDIRDLTKIKYANLLACKKLQKL